MSVNKDYYSLIHEASRSEDSLYDVVRELPLNSDAIDTLIEFCYDNDFAFEAFEFLFSEDEGFEDLLYEHRRKDYWELLHIAKDVHLSFQSGEESLYGERGYVTTLNKFESDNNVSYPQNDDKSEIAFDVFEVYGEDYKSDASYIKLEKASVRFDGKNIRLKGVLKGVSMDILLFIIPMNEVGCPIETYSYALETNQGEGTYEVEIYSPRIRRTVNNVAILIYYF